MLEMQDKVFLGLLATGLLLVVVLHKRGGVPVPDVRVNAQTPNVNNDDIVPWWIANNPTARMNDNRVPVTGYME